jgi:superfamily II DNA or RNA helicase
MSDNQQLSIQYDGHVALVQGLGGRPIFPAPFMRNKVDAYEHAGLPMTVEGDAVYLHTYVPTGGYLIPTGLLARLLHKPYYDGLGRVIERRTETVKVDAQWVMSPKLRDYQAEAVSKALSKKRCTISIPTGGGKSYIIEELCKALGNVLVLVPTILLLHQMAKQLAAYDVGLVGDGHLDMGHNVTIAIPDTLYNRRDDPTVKAWLATVPALIVDECHTFACPTGAAISALMRGTQYRIGLSATPCMDNLLEGLVGALAYEVKEQVLIDRGYILAPSIQVVKAPPLLVQVPLYLHQWYMAVRGRAFHPQLYQALYEHCILHNESRNRLIADIAKEYVDGNHGPLIIIVSRIEDTPDKTVKGVVVPGKVSHATVLEPLLKVRGLEYKKLSGTSTKRVREDVIRGLDDGTTKLVIAGANILKEGVNIIQTTGTIIAGAGAGGKDQRGLIQQAGRLLRVGVGKARPTLYIMDDDSHPYFSNQSRVLVEACRKVYGVGNVTEYKRG